MTPEQFQRLVHNRVEDVDGMMESFIAVKGEKFAEAAMFSMEVHRLVATLAFMETAGRMSGAGEAIHPFRDVLCHMVAGLSARGLSAILGPGFPDLDEVHKAGQALARKTLVIDGNVAPPGEPG